MTVRIVVKSKDLIKEVSFKDALETFYSKKIIKAITVHFFRDKQPSEAALKNLLVMVKNDLNRNIPNDIEDKEKGLVVLWIKRMMLSKFKEGEYPFAIGGMLNSHRGKTPFSELIEKYFHFKDFVAPEFKDLNKIQSPEQLKDVVEDAEPKYQAHLQKKQYLDAEQGKDVVYSDENWEIVIPTNKGAACELGKGTDWCTAAPGLDYYEHYHKKEDPLFVIVNKSNPEERYQFHYGTEQFMDKYDRQVSYETFLQFHRLILKLKNSPEVVKNFLNLSSDGYPYTIKEYNQNLKSYAVYQRVAYSLLESKRSKQQDYDYDPFYGEGGILDDLDRYYGHFIDGPTNVKVWFDKKPSSIKGSKGKILTSTIGTELLNLDLEKKRVIAKVPIVKLEWEIGGNLILKAENNNSLTLKIETSVEGISDSLSLDDSFVINDNYENVSEQTLKKIWTSFEQTSTFKTFVKEVQKSVSGQNKDLKELFSRYL